MVPHPVDMLTLRQLQLALFGPRSGPPTASSSSPLGSRWRDPVTYMADLELSLARPGVSTGGRTRCFGIALTWVGPADTRPCEAARGIDLFKKGLVV